MSATDVSSVGYITATSTLSTCATPPPNYDRWFSYAIEKKCDYVRLARDFALFYQLATRDLRFFRRMVEKFSAHVPPTLFLLNGRGEPSALRQTHGAELALNDTTPPGLVPQCETAS
ncbi:hypothetical protein C8J57DRAFT_1538155 [Mycena rebaudengoi]|nr:hypothetical protein C8J57DRAFT_1538155 [Mycena rebaudengoi]